MHHAYLPHRVLVARTVVTINVGITQACLNDILSH